LIGIKRDSQRYQAREGEWQSGMRSFGCDVNPEFAAASQVTVTEVQ
jgi:hypothetical protein